MSAILANQQSINTGHAYHTSATMLCATKIQSLYILEMQAFFVIMIVWSCVLLTEVSCVVIAAEEDADKSPDDVQSNSSTIHTATATPDSLSAPPMAALSAEPLSPSNALPNPSPKPRSSQSCVSPPNMTDAIIHGHASMSEKLKHLEAPASDSNMEKSSGETTSVHDTMHKSADTHCRPTGVAELKVETTEGKPNMPNLKPPAQCAQKSTASPSIHMMAAANRQTPSHHGQHGTQLPSKPSSASTAYRAEGNERHTFPLQGTHGGR